jgi:hypothetical protein
MRLLIRPRERDYYKPSETLTHKIQAIAHRGLRERAGGVYQISEIFGDHTLKIFFGVATGGNPCPARLPEHAEITCHFRAFGGEMAGAFSGVIQTHTRALRRDPGRTALPRDRV